MLQILVCGICGAWVFIFFMLGWCRPRWANGPDSQGSHFVLNIYIIHSRPIWLPSFSLCPVNAIVVVVVVVIVVVVICIYFI